MTEAAADTHESAQRPTREELVARWLLVFIGVGYLVAQLVLFSYRRGPGWDESVYLSQVTPGAKAWFFMASRARGITFLVAPVTLLGGSVAGVRLFLEAVASTALIASFWLWIPVVGLAAPVAALLFASSWVTLVSGSEVMPNIWAAMLGLAVVGLTVRRLAGGARKLALLASAALAVMALFRPTEATLIMVALAAYIAAFERPKWTVLIPLGIGLLLGWLPWVVEMSLRFGGPFKALSDAGNAHFAFGSAAHNARKYLAETNGSPTRIVPVVALTWLGLGAMAVVALVRRGTARKAIFLCCLVALVFLTEYLVFVSALAPRFLLPAYPFAALAAAAGAVSLIRGSLGYRIVGVLVLASLIPWIGWQGHVANRLEAQMVAINGSATSAGLKIREMAGGRGCVVASPHWSPQIALASGCVGHQLVRPYDSSVARLQSESQLAYVALRRRPGGGSTLSFLEPLHYRAPAGGDWLIYQVSG